MVKKEKDYTADIEEFAANKVKDVVWKTPEGQKQLQSVIQYKKDNPNTAIKTLVEFLKVQCEWKLTNRYIFDIIVTTMDKENDK